MENQRVTAVLRYPSPIVHRPLHLFRLRRTTGLVLAVCSLALAQSWQRGRKSNRADYPQWQIDKQFEQDVFTFTRVQYDSYGGRGRRGAGWKNDHPDCDWNFSARLQQLTSLEVDPNGKVVRMDDDELFDHPFLYMSNCNSMSLTDSEATALRRYLMNGGFIMADDFWGPDSWNAIQEQMALVLPDRKPVEISWDHPLFHIVYDLKVKPQVPSIRAWRRGYTYEYWYFSDPNPPDTDPHFWVYLDDNNRIMALMCQNNDIGDGWEREGEEREFFELYSEKVSYPLGINIITYAMTH